MKLIILISILSTLIANDCSRNPNYDTAKQKDMSIDQENLEIATLGGGCFWCVEAVFQQIEGVYKVVSGYSGGHIKNPSYKEVTTGTTGHAEVCQIYFDSSAITYEDILEIFWTTHDPTTPNRQGNDVGPQYRSIILFHSDDQKSIAEKSKGEVATGIWEDPIVTEIELFNVFYEAEEYHQDFYKLNPNYGYCRVIINPKIAKVREKFADRLKKIK